MDNYATWLASKLSAISNLLSVKSVTLMMEQTAYYSSGGYKRLEYIIFNH
jgi:hypothetical protein